MEQEIYLKEEGFSPEKCIAELESPVSSKFVSVRINGERNEYFNLRKTSLAEIVDIMLLRTQSGKVLEEMKSIITRLEKETSTKNEKMIKETTTNPDSYKQATETPMFGNNDNFAQAITEAGIKAAKATHEFNMKEIKAQMLADLAVAIAKTRDLYDPETIADYANRIAKLTLENP